MRWPCVCCGCFTLPAPTGTSDEICPVCFWQDDAVDNRGTDVLGPNKVPLTTARANYRAFGASEERVRGLVREPERDELPPTALEEILRRDDEYERARQRILADVGRGWDLGTDGRISWRRDELHER